MATLSLDRIATLLSPYLDRVTSPVPATLYLDLSLYLDLLLRWSARINLTAIREPESMVTRHFGESLLAATLLPKEVRTVLDLGSGAGFPGLPLHLLRPDLSVTLAESQQKKCAFLREVVRTLCLSTTIHAGRAEDLLPDTFDLVTMRAVDNPRTAFRAARTLSKGSILLLSTQAELLALPQMDHQTIRIPQRTSSVVALFTFHVERKVVT